MMHVSSILVVAILALGTSLHAGGAQQRRLTIGKLELSGHTVTVIAASDSQVHVTASDWAFPADAGTASGCAVQWANSIDSVVRVPAHAGVSEELRFDPVWMNESGANFVYQRILTATGPPHRLSFHAQSRVPLTALSMTDAQLSAFTGYLRRASKATDSLSRLAPSRCGEMSADSERTYFEFQVERQALPSRGNPVPRYPDALRAAKVEGVVLAQFVVDTGGRADMRTLRILKSAHSLFTDAVVAALPAMQFSAAEVGGKKVRQLVQMPFGFDVP